MPVSVRRGGEAVRFGQNLASFAAKEKTRRVREDAVSGLASTPYFLQALAQMPLFSSCLIRQTGHLAGEPPLPSFFLILSGKRFFRTVGGEALALKNGVEG